MKILYTDSYSEMSMLAADVLLSFIQGERTPLLCIASGDTPLGTYQRIHERSRSGTLDCREWKVIALDEWVGLNSSDAGSCGEALNRHFIEPLRIPKSNHFLFDGRAADLVQECQKAESFLQQQGGLDIAILGLGVNGHIGLNEPGSTAEERTRVTNLQEQTAAVGQKYFSQPAVLQQGITLGLGNLLEARHLLLLVSGLSKAPVMKRLIEEPPTSDLPASLLRSHPSFTIIVDEAAASLLHR